MFIRSVHNLINNVKRVSSFHYFGWYWYFIQLDSPLRQKGGGFYLRDKIIKRDKSCYLLMVPSYIKLAIDIATIT